VPHSYNGCSQRAPDEHILLSVTEEAVGIMADLFLGSRRDAAPARESELRWHWPKPGRAK
jgi:hypothetical protein